MDSFVKGAVYVLAILSLLAPNKGLEWDGWSGWSTCSSSCGVGLQKRSRTCLSPQYDCLGDSVDYAICATNPCAGYWSDWEEWAGCSVTCGVGLRQRQRSCDQDGPSYRFVCEGEDVDTELCVEDPCKGWTEWDHWGLCSTTCGSGIRYRHRQCGDVPRSRSSCVGNNQQSEVCKSTPCPVPVVSFKARGIGNVSPRYRDVIQFTDIVHNEGRGYDNVTGIFTTPVNGVYLFTVQLCPYSHYETVYAITVDERDVVRSAQVGKDVHACRTFEALVNLQVSSTVKVTTLDNGEEVYQTNNHLNTFTGVLLNY